METKFIILSIIIGLLILLYVLYPKRIQAKKKRIFTGKEIWRDIFKKAHYDCIYKDDSPILEFFLSSGEKAMRKNITIQMTVDEIAQEYVLTIPIYPSYFIAYLQKNNWQEENAIWKKTFTHEKKLLQVFLEIKNKFYHSGPLSEKYV
jgi:hypothetical protein